MQLHQIKQIHKSKKGKRTGRGGKRGSYSGRGQKGQKSRAGRNFEPIIRQLIKRYPKLRGYKFQAGNQGQTPKVILNLDVLEKKFNSGEKINPKILLEKGLISKIKGRMPEVKILGKDGLTKKLLIDGCRFSKSAKKAIEKSGGMVK